MILASDISFANQGMQILRPMTLSFQQPELVAILGPNGAGKSTLLQMLAGLYAPTTGTIIFNKRPIDTWKPAELARQRSFLHQQNNVSGAFSVAEILEMGRYPYFDLNPSAADHEMVENMITELGLTHKRKQIYQSLSGGEQQRIQFARTLLQLQETDRPDLNNKVMFLDEPLNNLDLQYQYALMQRAREKITHKGGTVIAVLHDINMAYQFADRVLILKNGHLVVDDATEKALNPEVLSSIFEVEISKFSAADNTAYFSTKAYSRRDPAATSAGQTAEMMQDKRSGINE
jgi:iron complex transport system ATP-binding protein